MQAAFFSLLLLPLIKLEVGGALLPLLMRCMTVLLMFNEFLLCPKFTRFLLFFLHKHGKNYVLSPLDSFSNIGSEWLNDVNFARMNLTAHSYC